ncbi:ABC transporter ATP-binding protein [Virgibacillus sp. NKC19-3]|uniref:ABC transporter ATP-binding protein n=1 Tax=Virgibacillus saliphilus TaxID=2831674 RepID=UPI001C9B5231|nr:ABC transporter ATP-binding protein [Virgibacillus sp. NKC19-3]MBY7142613.1 ABC transporter ATP-binding protein [Virgibacillus sp. NKC19-3]
MMNKPIVETNHLTKTHGAVKSVNKVDLHVLEGEIYGFLGPNGAGKTTTLKMLLGLIKPTEGEIHILGKDLRKYRSSILQHTGSLVESPSYYGHLTGLENMLVMKRLRDAPMENVNEALRIVRLEKQKDKKVNQYSLGMKQRLGMAMALLSFPKLLILDEPTNGLDPAGIGEMRELIKSLPSRYGMTILLSSHLLSEMEQMATSVGIINDGNLLYQGSMDDLRQKSRSTIQLKTEDDISAQQLLERHGYHLSLEASRITFANNGDAEVAKINKRLIDNDIMVTRIEEKELSLEDIFLELTGKGRNL